MHIVIFFKNLFKMNISLRRQRN